MNSTHACNICNDQFHTMLLGGNANDIAVSNIVANCPSCKSRPRIKTMRIAIDQHVTPHLKGKKEDRRALVISAVKYTRERIAEDFGKVISAALYGNYGKDTIASDLCDLKEFDDSSFDYIHATLVLDYIEHHDRVFASVKRVLKPGGRFLFHIAETRLCDDDTSTFVKNYKKEIIYKDQYPKDYQMPSIRTGRKYLLAEMERNGLESDEFVYDDIFSGETCTWFLGRKI